MPDRRGAFQFGGGGIILVNEAHVEGILLRDDDRLHIVRGEEHPESLGTAGECVGVR